jgi:hypothetical protein
MRVRVLFLTDRRPHMPDLAALSHRNRCRLCPSSRCRRGSQRPLAKPPQILDLFTR